MTVPRRPMTPRPISRRATLAGSAAVLSAPLLASLPAPGERPDSRHGPVHLPRRGYLRPARDRGHLQLRHRAVQPVRDERRDARHRPPYDDVTPDGGVNQAGPVSSASPAVLTVTVGSVH